MDNKTPWSSDCHTLNSWVGRLMTYMPVTVVDRQHRKQHQRQQHIGIKHSHCVIRIVRVWSAKNVLGAHLKGMKISTIVWNPRQFTTDKMTFDPDWVSHTTVTQFTDWWHTIYVVHVWPTTQQTTTRHSTQTYLCLAPSSSTWWSRGIRIPCRTFLVLDVSKQPLVTLYAKSLRCSRSLTRKSRSGQPESNLATLKFLWLTQNLSTNWNRSYYENIDTSIFRKKYKNIKLKI